MRNKEDYRVTGRVKKRKKWRETIEKITLYGFCRVERLDFETPIYRGLSYSIEYWVQRIGTIYANHLQY